MELEQVLLSTIAPAAISIGVAIINNQRQKSIEFDYEFKKYILERRKAVYDNILWVMDTINSATHVNNFLTMKIFVPEKEEGDYHFGNFVNRLPVITKDRIWLSDEMYELYLSLRTSVYEDLDKLRECRFDEHVMLAIGRLRHKHYVNLYVRMRTRYFIDLSSLNRVDRFLKLKRNEVKRREVLDLEH